MMKHFSRVLLVATLLLLPACAQQSEPAPDSPSNESTVAARSTSPAGAASYIIAPEDGATVKSPVTVKFGLRGMGVAPAGVQVAGTGHHHLMVDVDELPAFDEPLPADSNHIHFGQGQTETTLDLEPGQHTLQLVLGDFSHTPHDPPVVSDKVTITVEE